MYNSKYYTCEQIDQRLLQGYVDDYNSYNHSTLTQLEYLELLSKHLKHGLTTSDILQTLGDNEDKVVSQKALATILESIVQGGITLLQSLGDSEVFGISQKVITQYITNLQSSIDSIIEQLTGIPGSISSLCTDLSNEVNRATGAEAGLDNRITEEVQNLNSTINEKETDLSGRIDELQNQVDSVLVVQTFGDSTTASVSQAAITREIQNIYARLVDITGEQGHGMILSILPDYFWEEAANITINATVENSVFDSLEIYANGELISPHITNTDNFTMQYTITEDTVIKAIGVVLGIKYDREHTITRVLGNLIVGTGQNYTDVIESGIRVPYTDKGDHNIQVSIANDGDYIFVLLAATSISPIHHILMSSFLVPTEVITTDQWIIYKSTNSYRIGNYLICIN